MIMKKFIRFTVLAAAVAATGAANALDFDTVVGSSFTEYFSVTPTTTNKLGLTVSGLSAQYSALSFEIMSGPTVVATLSSNSLVAVFNDKLNNSYALTGGTPYSLKITGTTKAAIPGTYGTVSISALNGTVSPVPELESYAMLLAGLGLVGTLVRRRKGQLSV
jgi:hypothetical protein